MLLCLSLKLGILNVVLSISTQGHHFYNISSTPALFMFTHTNLFYLYHFQWLDGQFNLYMTVEFYHFRIHSADYLIFRRILVTR